MRKQVTPNKICECCGTILTYGKEEVFCDICKGKIVNNMVGRITVFMKGDVDSAYDFDVCSWKCVVEWFKNPTINTQKIQFITIPYVAESRTKTFADSLKEFLEAFNNEGK